ncbi:hypothetical protein KCP74_07665 [Salmonella enterica subsp. enterica]|nr:hypothetical protein KCP74_07665 [Salmonella enterica subsp. enterica]
MRHGQGVACARLRHFSRFSPTLPPSLHTERRLAGRTALFGDGFNDHRPFVTSPDAGQGLQPARRFCLAYCAGRRNAPTAFSIILRPARVL